MRLRSRTRVFALSAVALASLTAIPATTADAHGRHRRPKEVSVQILSLNDFHGQLEVVNPTASSGGRIGALAAGACTPPGCYPAGGVEYLATHVRNLRAENRNTVFASAGDLIGATPLLSALFHDEPTIEAFNKLGLDYNGVGNHEFDEGIDELLRMQYGNHRGRGYHPARWDGCHPVDGCGDGDPFRGAKFDFLAANVVYKDSGKTIFPPYAIRRFPGGVKVAFVGMTLEGTPLIVSPDGIASVNFLDEAESVNALVPHLRRRGVEAIVVLLHEGGSPSNTGGDPTLINSCNNPTGALPPIVEAMDDEIDIVITGHTNWAVNCLIDGKVVTGAASQARLITDIDAKINTRHARLHRDPRQQQDRHPGRRTGGRHDGTDRRVQRVRRTDRRRSGRLDERRAHACGGARRGLDPRALDRRRPARVVAGGGRRRAVRADEPGRHPLGRRRR